MSNYKYEFLSEKGKVLSTGTYKGNFAGAVSKVRRAIARKKKPWIFCDLYIQVDGKWLTESRWISQKNGRIIEYL